MAAWSEDSAWTNGWRESLGRSTSTPPLRWLSAGFGPLHLQRLVQNTADLLDRALDESLQLVILRALAGHFDDYVAFHGVRSRRSGTTVYIDLFLEFEGRKTMAEVQQTIASLQTELERHIPGSRIVIAPATAKVV